ncbi:MAG TPA: hypothetical protein PKC43_00305 [Phycisphaerales bacterium]|nr:hypothetical protein [Phycisphaerales bacterium]HMP35866.1 hypothetical protein [Phycisphaerales bacterium]
MSSRCTIGLASFFVFSCFAAPAGAGALPFAAGGANASDVLSELDAFRAALGPLNGNVPGSFGGGRREINWDGVPDGLSSPNAFPGDFFNAATPGRARGALFATDGTHFEVSARTPNPTNTPLNFGNIDPAYETTFQAFSPQRLFTAVGSTVTETTFFVPGTITTPATVKGFGAIFNGVEILGSARIECFDALGAHLATVLAPVGGSSGFSFAGVVMTGAERIASVVIHSGTLAPLAGNVDDLLYGEDVVVMDDFIYGEPISLGCPADLNGNGVVDGADLGIFLAAWGPNLGHPADFDGDGLVYGSDLGVLLSAWGACGE